MLDAVFAPQIELKDSSRLPSLSRSTAITTAELACLLLCGALGAVAVGLLHLQLRVPGHAILRGAFPMAMGLALVPRRGAGILMAIAAGITATAMSAAQVGVFPATSMLSVLALGPVLDLALLGPSTGWKLYARFAAAGAIANLLAYGLRLAGLRFGIETAGGGGGGNGGGGGARFLELGTFTLLSFLICGALAGLIGAAAWFRARAKHDLRRD
jgi:hypothetical protein